MQCRCGNRTVDFSNWNRRCCYTLNQICHNFNPGFYPFFTPFASRPRPSFPFLALQLKIHIMIAPPLRSEPRPTFAVDHSYATPTQAHDSDVTHVADRNCDLYKTNLRKIWLEGSSYTNCDEDPLGFCHSFGGKFEVETNAYMTSVNNAEEWTGLSSEWPSYNIRSAKKFIVKSHYQPDANSFVDMLPPLPAYEGYVPPSPAQPSHHQALLKLNGN